MKPRTYHTLLLLEHDDKGSRWAIGFGDYDRDTVEFERDDHRDHGYRAKELKIITTTDLQADIDAAVRELNEDQK